MTYEISLTLEIEGDTPAHATGLFFRWLADRSNGEPLRVTVDDGTDAHEMISYPDGRIGRAQ